MFVLSDKIKLKIINAGKTSSNVFSIDKRKSKIVIVNVCSTDEIESKRVHISFNTIKVKGAMD